VLIQGFSIRSIAVRASGTAAVTTDEYFNLVTLLLPGNGTNGAQNNTFLDSSTNAFSVTRNGNPTQGTFSPFSQTGWSGYFDGSGDYLTSPSNAAVNLSTGDFTIEAWIYRTSSTGGGVVISNSDNLSADNNYFYLGYSGSGAGYFEIRTTSGSTSTTGTINGGLNTWVHIAVSRESGTVRLFVNGVLDKTVTMTGTLTQRAVLIGGFLYPGFSEYYPGYISNARIVKGTAVYTSAFTPPTAPLTAISGTSLLTCQSNRFIDNSTNAFAITVNGNTSVEAFSPFDPAAAYAASTVGGSGYFDGTGDYFSIADNTALDMEASSFTIEAWVYAPSTINSNAIVIYCKRATTDIYGGVIFGIDSSNRPVCYATVDGSNWNVTMTSGTQTIVLRTWNHVALTRNGNIWTIWVNGVSSQTTTVSGTVPNNAAAMVVNAGAANGGFTGSAAYIAGLRVVKGTAVYTAAFTPPTTPPTAIANTSLLLNYTNAGITDATAKNVLETVGGAAISTTQSKFGGSSMAFDGNGDGLFVPYSSILAFGTGNFTIEFWLRFNSISGYQSIISFGYVNQVANGWLIQTGLGDGKMNFYRINASDATLIAADNGSNSNINQWYHIAIVRKDTSNFYIYRDGNAVGTSSDSSDYNPSTLAKFYVGGGSNTGFNNYYLNGYINDLRITRGYARYTANFTPPTQAFPTQ
jgi:hypothetical protein